MAVDRERFLSVINGICWSIAEDKMSWNLSKQVLMHVSDNTKSQFKICSVSFRPLKSAFL